MKRPGLLRSWPRPGSVAGDVAVLMSWGALAQGLNVLFMPLLTRIYDPGQFGLFAVFTNAAVLLGVVAAMRYEFAVVLPPADRDAALVVWIATETAVVFAAAIVVALMVAGSGAAGWRIWAGIGPWRFELPVAVLLVATGSTQAYWAIRRRRFSRLGLSKFVMAICTGAVQLGSAWMVGARTGGLIAGLVAGQLAGTVFLAWGNGVPLRWAARWGETLALARRYSHFPRYAALGSGLDGISRLIPVAVLTTTFGPVIAGQFALADRALRAPSILLGSSLSQVFFHRLSERRADAAECRRMLRGTWKRLAMYGSVPMLGAMLAGPWAFAMVFGSRWYAAGQAARALAPGVFAYFVAYPTSNVLVVFERLGLLLIWEAAYVGLVAAIFLLGPASGRLSPLEVLWTFSGALVVLHGTNLFLQWQVVGQGLSMNDAGGKIIESTSVLS